MKTGITILILLLSCTGFAQNREIHRGNEFYRNGDFAQAERQYRVADTGIGSFNLANALIQQKKYGEALQTLDRLVAKEKGNAALAAAAHYNAGVVYGRQKDWQQSIEAYKATLRLNPTDTDARENLQKAMRELKQQQKENAAKQNKPAKIEKSLAQQKLAELEKKEQRLQQRLQAKQKGQSMENDW